VGAAFSRDGAGFGREVSPRMASEQVGKVATPRRGRGNTQAQPVARQAGKEARRERIKIGRTVCISRLSGSEGGEGMRFASLSQIHSGANHPVSGAPRVGESEAGRPPGLACPAYPELVAGRLSRGTLRRTERVRFRSESLRFPVARPSPRSWYGVPCIMWVKGMPDPLPLKLSFRKIKEFMVG